MRIIKTSSTQITPEVGQILNSYSTSPLNTYSCNYINENGGGGGITYPVGAIYLSIDSTSPASLFGGSWEQITNDAYLKIVSTNAGSLGGTSSDHKIPINSMPSHGHNVGWDKDGAYSAQGYVYTVHSGGSSGAYAQAPTSNTGGGQPYYPYYYGIYVWKKVS